MGAILVRAAPLWWRRVRWQVSKLLEQLNEPNQYVKNLQTLRQDLRAGMSVASATPESGQRSYQQIGLKDRQSFVGPLGLQFIFFL